MYLRTILVVDDEPMVLAVTARLLERLGFVVLTAADGETGLEQLCSYPGTIDCALLDATLQGNTGIDLAQAMRYHQPGLPIVLMSGYAMADALALLVESGPTRFLPKPFQLSELRGVVYEAIEQRSRAVAG